MPHLSRKALVLFFSLVLGFTLASKMPAAGGPGNTFRREDSILVPPALPSDAIAPEHMRRYRELAVHWMQEYLRIDTTNPPGNEIEAARWFKRILDAEGIENRVFEYAPGRADVWARVRAVHWVQGKRVEGGRKRPIILLSHMDVVTSDPSHWRAPPFSAAIVDGAMYARGAQDMKSEGLAQLLVLVMIKREHPAMDRDVILLATADEEVHDSGTDWLIANHRELVDNAEFLITEGGETLVDGDDGRYVGIDVAEKVPFWLHVVAHGQPGHGSHPIEDSAPNRLVHALSRILAYNPEPKILPELQHLLADMAPYQPPLQAARFRTISQAVQDSSYRRSLAEDESLNSLLRDTISLTMLEGSKQTNVIPGDAWANLDVRLVPGEDPKDFLENIRKLVDDSEVSVEPLDGFAKGNSSPIHTELFAAIQRVIQHYYPGTPVSPRLASGYNESQRYRPLGIVCYGFSPYMATSEEAATEHADNERIRVEELRHGFRVLYDVVLSAN